jgi:protein-disulfide isomerase
MKKTITIIIVVLVVLGLAYYLFKISPQQSPSATSSSGYNAAITIPTNPQQISAPPAFDPTSDHYMGNPGAKNVFIEYGDMECPYCAEYSPMLSQVSTKFPDTVFVFRYFPLVQIHPNTVEAALAVEAAGAQGKFWEMHDLMFQNQSDWESLSDPLSTFTQYAQQVGVANIAQFNSDVTTKKYLATIQKDSDESYELNLQGTPSYFINGHQLQLAQDINSLQQEAQQYLNK